MTTCLYINDYVLGEFENVEIREGRLILKGAVINNYKLLSWLQGDPNRTHNLALHVNNCYGTDNVSALGSKIRMVDTDRVTVKKVVIDCEDIHVEKFVA